MTALPMASDAGSQPPSVLLCPECKSEHKDQAALFAHLAAAHPDLILGLPPRTAKRKPKSEKKKLTWKEEAMREILARENRGRKRAEAKQQEAKPAAATPKAAPAKPQGAPPAPPARPAAAAPPAPAPTPAPAPQKDAPSRCEGEHEWEAAGASQFLKFERCVRCGYRRMLSRKDAAPPQPVDDEPALSAAAARRLAARKGI